MAASGSRQDSENRQKGNKMMKEKRRGEIAIMIIERALSEEGNEELTAELKALKETDESRYYQTAIATVRRTLSFAEFPETVDALEGQCRPEAEAIGIEFSELTDFYISYLPSLLGIYTTTIVEGDGKKVTLIGSRVLDAGRCDE